MLGGGQDLAPLQAPGLRRPDRDGRRRAVQDAARDRRPVMYLQATAQPGGDLARGREGDRRGARALPRGGPDAEELERAQDRAHRRLRARRRADRRLRRQVRRAGPEPGLRRRSRRLQDALCSGCRRRRAADAARRGEALARRTASTCSRCSPSPSTRPRPATWTARSVPDARRARRARRFPTLAAGDAVERPEGRPGRAPRGAGREPVDLLVDAGYAADQLARARHGASSPATCSTRARRRARARRSATQLARARRRSSAPAPTSTRRTVDAVRAQGQPRPVARPLRRRGAEPVASRRPTSTRLEEAAARRDPAGEGAARSRWRCACCRGCSTARTTPTASRSPAPAPRRRSRAITRDDLSALPRRPGSSPNNATLVVVGDTTLAEIEAASSRRAFARLEGRRRAEEERRPRSRPRADRGLPHRPARRRAVGDPRRPARCRPRANPTRSPSQAMNSVLGGAVQLAHQHEPARGQALVLRRRTPSRSTPRGQRPFIVYAPVQTDKTKESMQEMLKELRRHPRRRGR